MSETVSERFKEDLSQSAESDSKEITESIRRNFLEQLENPTQGEDGLRNYVSSVKQARDESGRFTSSWEFEIEHPTARLHEFGGPIEPTYSKAMVEGWDRDGFYDALQDCESYVERKRLLKSAQLKTESQYD